MKLTPGVIINGRYKLEKIIATGGMGEMWLAMDNILAREVAVKALREENAGNEDFLQRLRIEARNNAVLTHPNIVALHDYYEQKGIGFIVMEYIKGESMGDLLRRHPVIPLPELLPILAQIARALGYAHKEGIIHRDIKPANILIDALGAVKVVDFGVSKAMDQINMTQAGMVVGTAQYLSPEQAVGENAQAGSDLYALGVIAYEASQGRRPFGGRNAVEIAIAQVNNPVPPMDEATNPQFRDLVMSLLLKSATSRPVDGDKLADQFDALLAQILAESGQTPGGVPGQAPGAKSGEGLFGAGVPDSPREPVHQIARTKNSPAVRIPLVTEVSKAQHRGENQWTTSIHSLSKDQIAAAKRNKRRISQGDILPSRPSKTLKRANPQQPPRPNARRDYNLAVLVALIVIILILIALILINILGG